VGSRLRIAVCGKWHSVRVLHVHAYHKDQACYTLDVLFEETEMVEHGFKLMEQDRNVDDARHWWAWNVIDDAETSDGASATMKQYLDSVDSLSIDLLLSCC